MPKCQGEVQSRVSLRYRTGPRALAIVRLVVSKMTIFNVAGTLVVPIASWKSKSDPVLMTASGAKPEAAGLNHGLPLCAESGGSPCCLDVCDCGSIDWPDVVIRSSSHRQL